MTPIQHVLCVSLYLQSTLYINSCLDYVKILLLILEIRLYEFCVSSLLRIMSYYYYIILALHNFFNFRVA